MPGGVSSPVRAFKAVGGTPPFIREASGSKIVDVDGNVYIDYVGSYGPLIAGHSHPSVVAAITQAASRGTSYGAPNPGEVKLAERITSAMPSIEMVRFVNSGTEAAMSAIRLARAATGRDKIVKCIGCYHGHSDGLLVAAGSGALTLGTPSSPGVPRSIAAGTISVHYNDLDGARQAFAQYGREIACFAVEPIAGNMGVVLPAPGYLAGLRRLCDEHGALLLFDEVMTGFRVGWGGAQGLYGVRPDLTCLGKIIGGGLPVGAYGGARHLMEQVSPSGPVYQAGTLSGNPLAMAAGAATLDLLAEPGAYERLESIAEALSRGLSGAADNAGAKIIINRAGSMMTPFIGTRNLVSIDSFEHATSLDPRDFAGFFNAMLQAGVYLPPSQFEAWFPGLTHTEQDVVRTTEAASNAFAELAALR